MSFFEAAGKLVAFISACSFIDVLLEAFAVVN